MIYPWLHCHPLCCISEKFCRFIDLQYITHVSNRLILNPYQTGCDSSTWEICSSNAQRFTIEQWLQNIRVGNRLLWRIHLKYKRGDFYELIISYCYNSFYYPISGDLGTWSKDGNNFSPWCLAIAKGIDVYIIIDFKSHS